MAKSTNKALKLEAIQPNVGEYLAFSRLLQSFFNDELAKYKQAALKAVSLYVNSIKDSNDNHLLLDLILSTELRYNNTHLNNKVAFDACQKPKDLKKLFSKTLYQNRVKSTKKQAQKIAAEFSTKVATRLTLRMRCNLKYIGINAKLLDKGWSIPLVKGQYVAPEVKKQLPKYISDMVSLISNMSERSHLKIQKALAKGVKQGRSIKDLTTMISGLENMTKERAARVAMDQSCKLNQFIQRENLKAIGVTSGIWLHVPGKFTSRHSHKHILNRKEYNLKEGLYDPEVGYNIQPGQLPYCKCTFRALIPKNLLTEPKK